MNLGGLILSKFKNKIKLLVFDDVNKVALGKSNYTRYLIDKYFDRIFFTDSQKIVETIKVFETKNLNLINNNILIPDNFVGNYKKGFYYSGSYYNGMAIIFPTERDYHRLNIKFNYFYKLKNFLKKFKEKFF